MLSPELAPVSKTSNCHGCKSKIKANKRPVLLHKTRLFTDSIDESQDRGPGKRSKPNRLKESPLGEGTDLLRSSDQGSKASR